jgi:hypothetical protein
MTKVPKLITDPVADNELWELRVREGLNPTTGQPFGYDYAHDKRYSGLMKPPAPPTAPGTKKTALVLGTIAGVGALAIGGPAGLGSAVVLGGILYGYGKLTGAFDQTPGLGHDLEAPFEGCSPYIHHGSFE